MHLGYIHAPFTLVVTENSRGFHCAEDWMGHRTNQDVVRKRKISAENRTPVVNPLALLYRLNRRGVFEKYGSKTQIIKNNNNK